MTITTKQIKRITREEGCAGCKGAVATDTAAPIAVYKKQVADVPGSYPLENAAYQTI